MEKYAEHFRLSERDVEEYIRTKLPDYFGEGPLEISEIGDGNINYVFRAKDKTGKSIIIKQADKFVRSTGHTADTDRNRIEAQILQLEYKLSPNHIPVIYLYDPVMCCVVMQDVGDHKNLRYALMNHETYPTLAKDMGQFLADTLISTSDLCLDAQEKKALVKNYINPSMCDISERLVFSEPYTNARGSNQPFAPNKDWLEQELYRDPALKLAAAKLKTRFMDNAQALIHGDLHSGSIFVKKGSTMVLDPEFAFFGPAGYDIGNVIAHFAIAWAAAEASMGASEEKMCYLAYLETCMTQVICQFRSHALELAEKATYPMFTGTDYQRWFVEEMVADAAGYAGTEIIRRIMGSAKVKDITTLTDTARLRAERTAVLAAKTMILTMQRPGMDPKEYTEALRAAAKLD